MGSGRGCGLPTYCTPPGSLHSSAGGAPIGGQSGVGRLGAATTGTYVPAMPCFPCLPSSSKGSTTELCFPGTAGQAGDASPWQHGWHVASRLPVLSATHWAVETPRDRAEGQGSPSLQQTACICLHPMHKSRKAHAPHPSPVTTSAQSTGEPANLLSPRQPVSDSVPVPAWPCSTPFPPQSPATATNPAHSVLHHGGLNLPPITHVPPEIYLQAPGGPALHRCLAILLDPCTWCPLPPAPRSPTQPLVDCNAASLQGETHCFP